MRRLAAGSAPAARGEPEPDEGFRGRDDRSPTRPVQSREVWCSPVRTTSPRSDARRLIGTIAPPMLVSPPHVRLDNSPSRRTEPREPLEGRAAPRSVRDKATSHALRGERRAPGVEVHVSPDRQTAPLSSADRTGR